MILYIHGFSSSGLSKKALQAKSHFKETLIAPTFSNIPELAFHTAEQLIEAFLSHGDKVHLIGSSMGGYMNIYLAHKYNLKAVLINPAITPYELTELTGMHKSLFDGSLFESTLTHLEKLRDYEVKNITKPENFLVLLQKGDELIPYEPASKVFAKSHLVIEEGGNHSFEGFESKLPLIEEFFLEKTL